MRLCVRQLLFRTLISCEAACLNLCSSSALVQSVVIGVLVEVVSPMLWLRNLLIRRMKWCVGLPDLLLKCGMFEMSIAPRSTVSLTQLVIV